VIPNYKKDVEAAAAKYPEAWRHAHVHGDPKAWDFIRLLAADLHAKDVNVGLNGKRGNPNDLSMDALNLVCEAADSAGRTPDGQPCVVVDVIVGAGGTNPQPGWTVFTTAVEGSGAWVTPGTGTIPPPQPPAVVPVVPGREEALDEMTWLDAYYAAPEGLQRPNGLSLNGKPDFEGIAAWYLDIYQQERIKGKNRADARAAYVTQIRHSDEWKQKHPGETP